MAQRERTAEEMVADVLKRTAMQFSEFVDQDEILEYLNQEFCELKGHIRRNEGQVHDAKSFTIPVVSGTSAYTIGTYASDFWEILSLEGSLNGTNRRLYSFMEAERAGLRNVSPYPWGGGPLYRLMGTSIHFLPASYTFTATVFYVPTSSRLRLGQNPPDKIEGFNGYEIAAIYGACAIVLEKEKDDPSFYERRKASIYALIDANAAQRDAGQPERVTDVTGGLENEFYGQWWR